MPMPTVIRGRLGALVKACDGVDAFAALMGVYPHTVWRWGTGRTTPSEKRQQIMNGLAKKRKLAIPFPHAAKQ